MIRREDVLRVGRVGKPHGVKGELSIQFDDDLFDIEGQDFLFIEVDGILVPFFMEEYRFRSNETALVKFEGVDGEDQAKALTGCDVYSTKQHRDDEKEERPWADLVGYRVVDATTHAAVGVIVKVDDTTMNTLFELSRDDGRNLLVPANANLVSSIDQAMHEVAMDIPDGLTDL